MIINATTDGTGTNPSITYGEYYAPLIINRKQYEDDLQRRQKEHLDNVFPIKRNRVFKGLAETGKSTMRWLFGFKLHFACNEWGRTFEFMLYAREN